METSSSNRVPLTKIQRLICERMLRSKRSKPCFYLEAKADVTEFMAMRHKLKKSLGIKITTNAFYIEAIARAVQKFPLMVATAHSDCLHIAAAVNIGFAVNAPHGLVVPIVKNADKKTLADIALEEAALTEKARVNKLTLEEMEGETIALSNLGAYDIHSFIAIVPPPASTILSVGNVIRTAAWNNASPEERKTVSLSLAADATVINEVYAAKFLAFIKDELRNPKFLL